MSVRNIDDKIIEVVEKWSKVARFCQGSIIVVNDGSDDKTVDQLKKILPLYDNLIVIHRNYLGHDYSYLQGIKWAVINHFEWVLTINPLTPDLGHFFMNLWQQKNNDNFVFGKRSTKVKKWLDYIIRLYLRMKFHISDYDFNTTFRLMKVSQLQNIITKLPENLHYQFIFLCIEILKNNDVDRIQLPDLNEKMDNYYNLYYKSPFDSLVKLIRDVKIYSNFSQNSP